MHVLNVSENIHTRDKKKQWKTPNGDIFIENLLVLRYYKLFLFK